MKDTGRMFKIFVGIFLLIGSLWLFVSGESLSRVVPSVLGVFFIFDGIFGMIQAYDIPNNGSYLSLFGIAIFNGLIVIYIYIFKPAFVKDPLFYVLTLGFTFLVIAAFGVYQRVNKYQKAVEPYEKDLIINPKDTTALNNKGAVMAEFRAYPRAIKCFEEVTEIDPNDAAAWHNTGYSLEKLKKHQEAIKYYDKALKVDPGFRNAKKSGKIILEN